MNEDPYRRSIELLFYSWGHGLRGKITTINDLVFLIRRKLADPSPDLAVINSKLDAIHQINQEITAIPSPFDFEPIQLNTLIAEYVKRRKAAVVHDEKIEIDLDPGQPVVTANPVWLERIFDILVDNAMEAMADLEFKLIQISTRMDRSGVIISIKDTGKGFDEQIAAILFQRPWKISGTRGRGLHIVQLGVELYGGWVKITDTSDAGTTIELQFPISDGVVKYA